MSEGLKQIADAATAGVGGVGFAAVLGWIQVYVPPFLLLSALLWAGMRWAEAFSGKKMSEWNWVIWLKEKCKNGSD